MKSALSFAALLLTAIVMIWLAGRKAARAEAELKNAKERIKQDENAGQILVEYLNMPASDVDDRVRQKREAAKQRMCSTDRLD